jgi:hypothetical protein
MKRRFAWLVALAVATLVGGVGSAAVAVPAPPGPGGLSLRWATVSLADLPAAARQRLAASTALNPGDDCRPGPCLVLELVNQQNNRCLDAATQNINSNGDKVQMWDCFNDRFNHPNQWWLALNVLEENEYAGSTQLINAQSGLCLDVDNSRGFVNGAKVQLWQCFDDAGSHPNQWWSFGPHTVPVQTYLPLGTLWGGDTKVLDAATQQINQNGGYVQIWQYLNGVNQHWLQ